MAITEFKLERSLQAQAQMCWEQFVATPGQNGVQARREETLWVWALSEFCAQTCIRNPDVIEDLIDSGDLDRAYNWAQHAVTLRNEFPGLGDRGAAWQALRRLRSREMLRIAWRDLAGKAGLGEVLNDLSRFADCAIDLAYSWCYQSLAERFGAPVHENGDAMHLVVLGMGKLGGSELNFSSDVDLIFAYPQEGVIAGEAGLTHQEFFVRLGQALIQFLQEPTVDGFVYRTDMRLRPFGKSGPLACSFSAMEDYYATHGRDWERYALIKARPVAGDLAAGNELLRTLKPFVYRRYLDFGAFGAIREMKVLINAEVRRKSMQDNIKLGSGGIREVEFIGQAFQLVRGGQDAAYRKRGIQDILRTLAVEGEMSQQSANQLLEAYDFLRRAENRLQMEADRQMHVLPEADLSRQRLATAMAFEDWESFLRCLSAHRQRVQQHFDHVFDDPIPALKEASATRTALTGVWLGQLDDDAAAQILSDVGYENAQGVLSELQKLREGRLYEGLRAEARSRMDRFMPLMLAATAEADQPAAVFTRVLRFVEAVARRSVYLVLLSEREGALKQLVMLTAASPWIADHLCRHPMLLDELLDPRLLYHPPDLPALRELVAREFADIETGDLERAMDSLRRIKHGEVLRVAAADVTGHLPLMKVSDHLTWIAEALLEAAISHVTAELTQRYGEPQYLLDGQRRSAGFAVIAYGKLGGIELGYGSDLDLVFLHDSQGEQQQTSGEKPIDNAVFFARLAQRLIHLISTYTPTGVAYEIDPRLRPNGNSGALVSAFSAYERYQLSEAWTWEHQALVRARCVWGAGDIAQRFAGLRKKILSQARDSEKLRVDVAHMREQMRTQLGSGERGKFHIKQDAGGIADIEFLVQYMVLAHTPNYPDLAEYTDVIRILDCLEACQLLSSNQIQGLADAYRSFRGRIHQLTLKQEKAVVDDSEFVDERALVSRVWAQYLGSANP